MTSYLSTKRAPAGHVLIYAIFTLCVMALLAVFSLGAISARYKTAMRVAAWHESLLIAESGVDMTLSQVTGLLPNIQLTPQSGLSAATSPFSLSLLSSLQVAPGGLNLANGLSVSLTPDPLIHGGEGATTSTATVTIQVLPLSQVLNGNLLADALGLLTGGTSPAINLLQIRSKGTVYLPGSSRVADVSKLDVDLLHAALIKDPLIGQLVTQPNVSREIEVLLKPVFPFENGVSLNGSLQAPSSSTVFDSFSSASSQTSTNGLYDITKRLSNVIVSSNSSNVQVGGVIYGNANTNGGNLVQGPHVTGAVNNAAYRQLPPTTAPTWSATSTAVSGTQQIAGGLLTAPAQYTFSQVNGTLHVTGNVVSGLGSLLGSIPVVGGVLTSKANIYVTGNFNGTLIVDAGVQVQLYVQGSVNLGTNGLQNTGGIAANVQIYGVPSTSGSAPTMTIDTTNNPVAAIYAPTHAITLTGDGAFSGALTGSQLTISSEAGFHYDEALAVQIGPIIGYSLVSSQEIPVQ
jgi:hypothetical protein